MAAARIRDQAQLTEVQGGFARAGLGDDAKAASLQESRALDAAVGEKPFGAMDDAGMERLMGQVSAGDPGCLNTKLLRLQFRMQQEALRYTFASNKLKGDQDDAKVVIGNLR